jgi:hypothetical protein
LPNEKIITVVRRLTDGSLDSKDSSFPGYLWKLLEKVGKKLSHRSVEALGIARIEYMKRFLDHLKKELTFEA